MTEIRPVLLVSRLYAGQELAYERAHRAVPQDMRIALERAGARDWVIWRCGQDLMHLIEVDDYDDMTARLAADAANAEWQETMRAYVSGFSDTHKVSAFKDLKLVWSLRRQQHEEGVT